MKEHCVAQRKGSSTEGRRLEKRKGDGEFGKQIIIITRKLYDCLLWKKENSKIKFN